MNFTLPLPDSRKCSAPVSSPRRQWCGLRPSVLGQDLFETKKIGFGLGRSGLVLCCETRSCHAGHQSDLEGHSNFQVLFIVGTCKASRFYSNSNRTSRFEFDSKVTFRFENSACRVPSYHKLRSLTVQQRHQPLRRL